MNRLTIGRVSVGIAAIFAVLRLLTLAPFEVLDLKLVDIRHQLRGPIAPSGEVIIVAIDEASLAEVGRWPWPRARLAQLVDRLTQARVRAIGFDLIFDQRDPSVDLAALVSAAEAKPSGSATDLLRALQTQLDNDARFADALRASGRVVLAHFFEFGPSRDGEAPGEGQFPEVSVRLGPGSTVDLLPRARSFHGNIPRLADAAAGAGHINFFPDPDGGYRRVPLVLRLGDRPAPAFSLELLRRHLGGAAATVTLAPFGVARVRVGELELPVDEEGQLWVNYLGPPGTFPYLGAADVLAGRFDAAAVAGRTVLVAPTAPGFDFRATPFGPVVPGVEIEATVIDDMLHGRSLWRPRWLVPAEALIVLLLGGAVGFVLHHVYGLAGVAASLSIGLAYAGVTQGLFTRAGLVLSGVYPLGAVLFSTLGGSVLQYVAEEREKRKIRTAFRHYLNPEVTELLAAEPERLRLGGERREITIFFSDIRGFTTIAEELAPETLVELLNDYLGAMTGIVLGHQGLLDKYIGDAIMAFWGAPVSAPDHAARCCRAALEMLAALPALHERWQARGWPRLEIGIGIDTGEVVVGNFGSSQRFNYTAMGDRVNLASRLEGLNKVYDTRVLVSEATRRQLGEEFLSRELDRVRVKGKTQPVAIHELLGRRSDDRDGRLRRLEDLFARALAAYRARAWDEARARLEELRAAYPADGPTRLYLERCRILAAEPPDPTWEGVFEAKTK